MENKTKLKWNINAIHNFNLSIGVPQKSKKIYFISFVFN